jgi:arylsulfatase A-like enzyme
MGRWCIFLVVVMLAPASAADDRSNILLLLIDDLGCRDLATEGHPYHATPNIDRLAAQSVRFTNAYTNAPNCAPTRASILTGRYSPRHGILTVNSSARGTKEHRRVEPPKNTQALDASATTFAEVLQASGYRTAFLGKWHVSADPTAFGFDRNIGGGLKGSPRRYLSPYKNPTLKDGPAGEYLIDRLGLEASRMVREMESTGSAPWFVMYCPYAVHTPIQAPKTAVDAYLQAHPTISRKKATYAVMVERMDTAIGRVLDVVPEDTIVIFLSDNGGYGPITSHAPYRGSKGMLYDGGVRTPLYVRGPNLTPTTVDTPVISLDLFSTILDVANVPPPPNDGVSLLSKAINDRGAIFWHFPVYLEAYNRKGEPDAHEPQRPWRTTPVGGIRDGDWKLLEYFEDGGIELFNLRDDPGERTNLASSEPDRAAAMLQALRTWQVSVEAPLPTAP